MDLLINDLLDGFSEALQLMFDNGMTFKNLKLNVTSVGQELQLKKRTLFRSNVQITYFTFVILHLVQQC